MSPKVTFQNCFNEYMKYFLIIRCNDFSNTDINLTMNIFLGKINQFVLKIGDIPEEEEVSYETVVPTFVR